MVLEELIMLNYSDNVYKLGIAKLKVLLNYKYYKNTNITRISMLPTYKYFLSVYLFTKVYMEEIISRP